MRNRLKDVDYHPPHRSGSMLFEPEIVVLQ